MNPLLVTLLTVLYLVTQSGGELTCYCSTCPTEQCTGGYCTSQAGYDPNTHMVEYTWGCLTGSNDLSLCNTSSSIHTYLCCSTGDNCNSNLNAQIGLTEGTVSLATNMPGTGSTIPPILIPESGETPGSINPPFSTPESTPTPTILSPPPPIGSPSCFSADTGEGGATQLCPLTTSCYSTVRRMNNDTIVWRRGCTGQSVCMNITRNRKVKRCCYSHMCNIELNFEDFFPTIPPTEQTESIDEQPELSETTTVTDFTSMDDSTSDHFPIRPPILTPLSSTTSAPDTTGTQTLHCYCQSDNCISGTQLCSSQHACAMEYSIALGEVESYKQVCVDEESGCGVVGPNMFRSCCNSQLCNEDPNFDDVPLSILSTTTMQVMNSTPSHIPKTDFEFTISTIALSVIGVFITLLLMMIVVAVCYARRRLQRTKAITRVPAKTNIQHQVAAFDSSYHRNREDDAGRVSVQSTASNSSTPSNEKSSIALITSV